jgi:hypothetical protein
MKYLKKYSVFNEDQFDVDPNDPVNVKKSKENLDSVDGNIKEYNKLKPNIDSIYKTAKTDDEINKKIDDLLGKDKVNPYITNYLTVANDERKFKTMLDDMAANKLKIDEYKDLISQSDNEDQKKLMTSTITNLNSKILNTSSSISKLKIDVEKRKKDISNSTSNNLKEIEDDIKDITKTAK